MRLIDCDKLRDELGTEVLSEEVDEDNVIDDIIANVPTVEAIPVEWIEKKIEGLKDTDDYLGFVCINMHQFYQHVLEVWRRENEKNKI